MGPNRRAQDRERAAAEAAAKTKRAEAERKAVADGRRPSIRRGLRAASVIGAALAVLIGIGGGQALALAGCDAVNAGGFNGFFAASSITIGGFTVGDKLTFTLVAGGADWRLENGSGGTVAGPTGFSGIQSYTVTSVGNDTTLTQRTTIFVPVQAMTVTATCVAAVSGGSHKLQ